MDSGEILLKRGLVNEDALASARAAVSNGDRVDEVLVRLGYLTDEQALGAIGGELGLDYVDLAEFPIDLGLIKEFPQRLIHKHNLLPLSRTNGSLTVATSDPFNWYAIDEAGAATGLSISPVLASKREISRLIKSHLGVGSETIEGLLAQAAEDDVELLEEIETDGSELSQMAQEASVVRLVNEILLEAIESRSSDVHVESQADGLRIRYRIDGLLVTQPTPPEISRFAPAIISRLKIMARLNIAEKRLPQDGRIKLKVQGREVDVRVSVIPMIHGEGIVMRILDKGKVNLSLSSVGMSGDIHSQFRKLIELPHGILLVTGPTGSGKTTTLYSSLIEINHPDTKIITAEDPVEYQLEGINQIQVHTKIGLSFAACLRSILRHDPDVVLVGEIRDLETAENAIQASLTGHLVFSTLHTNDAASAFTRLVDMGVEPFLVASTVEAVMAQRLVRKLCKECREEYTPTEDDIPDDFPRELLAAQQGRICRPRGCRACRQLGYAGRLGIFELLINSPRVRQLAHDGKSSWEIKKAGIEEGMRTLRQDGWLKVLSGVTSLEEVLRATKGDDRG